VRPRIDFRFDDGTIEIASVVSEVTWERVDRVRYPALGWLHRLVPPREGELATLFDQVSVVGGFNSSTYWSSCQSTPNYGWADTLGKMGNPASTQETFALGVRAIRAL